MKKNFNLHYIVICMLLAGIFFIVGCQKQPQEDNEDDNFQVLVFSSISGASLEAIKGVANMPVEMIQFPPVAERLILEIVQHSGDMLLMDRELLAAAYDSNELYELVEFGNHKNAIILTDFELEALRAAGEHAEKGDTYLNALQVNQIEVNESEPSDLVVIIPKYTKNKEEAFLFLEKISGE